MAGTKGIKAGRAYVELGTDDKKLVAGLRRAQRRLKAFGAGLRTMGTQMVAASAAMLAPLVASIKVFASAGDTLNKMSARTGITVEALSELGFAAEQSGADLEALEKGVRTLQRSVNDAGRGLSTAVDALDDLGVSFQDFQGLSSERQFKLVADRLAGIEDPSKRAALAMMLLGRAGTRLLPMMADGANGIEKLQRQFRALGLTVTSEMAAKAALLTDTLNALWRVTQYGVFVIGAALAPTVIGFANAVKDVVITVTAWIKENRALFVTALKVAAVVGIAGVALVGLGVVVTVTGIAIAGLATAISLLFSPIGLVITALGVIAGAFAYAALAGDTFSEKMQSVGRIMTTVFDAAGFAIKYWGKLWNYVLLGTTIKLGVFCGQIKHFFAVVIPTYLARFIMIWQAMFQTALNILRAFIVNVGVNLGNMWAAIERAMSGKGWQFDWTPLLKGAKLAFVQLPKIAEREIGLAEKALKLALNMMGKELAQAWEEYHQEREAPDDEAPTKGKPGLGKGRLGLGKGFGFPGKREIARAIEQAQARVSVVGTFNPAAARGLGGARSPELKKLEEIAKNTEDTKRGIKKLAMPRFT